MRAAPPTDRIGPRLAIPGPALRAAFGGGRGRLWVTNGVLVGAAAAAVLTNAPHWFFADARFEQFWGTQTYLKGQQWLWDPTRGLGQPTPYYSPVVGTFTALLRTLALSPAVAEHVLHTTYLIVAGLGMVQLLRTFRPRIGLEHLLAGLVYMFSPLTSQFLVPSGLFLHYAIAPWLLTAFVRGTRESRYRWYWAAVFALSVLTVGGLNTPSLLYAALPIVPAAVYLAFVSRTLTGKALSAFVLRAGLLTVLISAATVVYLRSNISGFAENLGGTELPSTVSGHSSWSESWRGLGNWLTYLRTPLGLSRPEALSYFTNPLVIGATFVVPIVAVAAVWRLRWDDRLLFAGLAGFSLLLMVGLYPPGHLPLSGHALQFAYNHSLALKSLRDTYKAGAGLAMGISALFGVGVMQTTRWLSHRLRIGSLWLPASGIVLALAVIGYASYPFWTGRLYSTSTRVHNVPEYWHSAINWLDHQPGDSRVLVLPGTNRTRYRWGYVGDDIFDALLSRPHLVRESRAQGSPQAANLLVALDGAARTRTYAAGSIGPIARRLGIGWIVVRNDVAWETTDAPRPSDLAGLRRDPDFERVATFGRVGQNVAAPHDALARALGETSLPPVEIYRVRDPSTPIQATASEPPLLVSGDGEAWPALASEGLLSTSGPIRYTANLSSSELDRLVAGGAPLVITDTTRRRVTQVTAVRNYLSPTLTADETLTRAPEDLFHRAGSQSAVIYPDAAHIESSTYGNPVLNPFQTWYRPANAFDGDVNTAWIVGGLQEPLGAWVRVDFKRAIRIGQIGLSAASTGRRQIAAAAVRFSDGSQVPVAFRSPDVTVTFKPRLLRWVEVRIRAVLGFSGSVGFSRITIPSLNLTETIATPTDVADAASKSHALARALQSAPVTFLFQRLVADGSSDAELALHRSFVTFSPRSYQVSGVLRIDSSTPKGPLRLAQSGFLGQSCTNQLLTVDGHPVPVRLLASSQSLVSGATVGFQGCGSVILGGGTHRLDSQLAVDGLISVVELTTGPTTQTVNRGPPPTIHVVSQSPTRVHVRVSAPHGGSFILGQSFDPGWHATAGGRDLGRASALNTASGWALPRGTTTDLVASYRPQTLWELALAVTGGATALCLWIVADGWLRRRLDPPTSSTSVTRVPSPSRAPPSVQGIVLPVVAMAAVGYALAGTGGAVIAGVATLVANFDAALVAFYAVSGLVITAFLNITEAPLDATPLVSRFVGNHPAATFVSRLTGVLWLVAIVTLWRAARRPSVTPSTGQPPLFEPVSSTSIPSRSTFERVMTPASFMAGFVLVLNLVGGHTLRWLSIPALVALLVVVLGIRRGPPLDARQIFASRNSGQTG